MHQGPQQHLKQQQQQQPKNHVDKPLLSGDKSRSCAMGQYLQHAQQQHPPKQDVERQHVCDGTGRWAPVSSNKVLGAGCPVRHGQVQQFRVDALKDSGVGVQLWYGFIRGPVVEAGEGGGVLLGLELGAYH